MKNWLQLDNFRNNYLKGKKLKKGSNCKQNKNEKYTSGNILEAGVNPQLERCIFSCHKWDQIWNKEFNNKKESKI